MATNHHYEALRKCRFLKRQAEAKSRLQEQDANAKIANASGQNPPVYQPQEHPVTSANVSNPNGAPSIQKVKRDLVYMSMFPNDDVYLDYGPTMPALHVDDKFRRVLRPEEYRKRIGHM